MKLKDLRRLAYERDITIREKPNGVQIWTRPDGSFYSANLNHSRKEPHIELIRFVQRTPTPIRTPPPPLLKTNRDLILAASGGPHGAPLIPLDKPKRSCLADILDQWGWLH